MHYRIKAVEPLEDLRVGVYFHNGEYKIYDVKRMFNKAPIFKQLEDPNLFKQVHVSVGGIALIWNDEIDLSCDSIYENGEEVPCPFKGIMSFRDATDLWGLNESTLRKAVSYGKLKYGQDVFKYGKQWVITEKAMIREYGNIDQ
ncbi:MAG: DUF2442 domain-containing protein [Coprobacillus sp.]|nr:DUF2442 domain-containing protein [Coprobacillus sp.]